MRKHDRLTRSASLRFLRRSLTVQPYGSRAAHPRLASRAILSVSLLVWLMTVSVVFAQSSGSLQNPLNPNFSDIPKFIAGALKVMVTIALPIISLFIVYSGFLFLTAQGSEEGLNKAKTNFKYVIIGAILILGAWVIATLIGGTVTQLTSGT